MKKKVKSAGVEKCAANKWKRFLKNGSLINIDADSLIVT